ncbi:hypothetical protein FRC06_010326, partial [Ceratobasidium sp. 370]
AATPSSPTAAPAHKSGLSRSLEPVTTTAPAPAPEVAPARSPDPSSNLGPSPTPVQRHTPVPVSFQPAAQMIPDYNQADKVRAEPCVETGVLVDRRENVNQKANGTRIEAEMVEVSRTQSKREVVSAMPAPASAEVRYDVDFVAENPVRQANTSSTLAFTLGTAFGRTNERRVWQNVVCSTAESILALTPSSTHGSTLASEQVHGLVLAPDGMRVSVTHTHPTAVSPTPVRDATLDPKRAPIPIYASRPASTHDLAPRPVAGPEPFISHATSGPVRVTVSAPTRNLGPDTSIAPTPSPAPASPSAPESTSNLAYYPTTPPTCTYAPSPVPVRASVHHPIAPQTPSWVWAPESTPAPVHSFAPHPAASPTPALRCVSLLVPSPSRPGKYLCASRRSVPAASGSTFAPQVVHDSVLAFTADPPPAPPPTSPTSRRAPPPAPIRLIGFAPNTCGDIYTCSRV